MRSVSLFIILPVHNRLEFTKKCLFSLKRQTYKNFKVIIIDDGSTDGTYSYIKRNFPRYKVIKGNGNWWWTKSVHKGIQAATELAKVGDFVLTMNNDCVFEKNYLSEILRVGINNKNSIVGSTILDAEKKDQLVDAGIRIDWKKGVIHGAVTKLSDLTRLSKSKKIIENNDSLPGKGTLVPVSVFKKAGNFNYRLLPHYVSDYEFFCRAKRYGFKLIVATDAKLYNFSKETGIGHISREKSTYSKVFGSLFSRKSKINIVDQFVFYSLCCPIRYLPTNYLRMFLKLVNYILELFPFYYIRSFLKIVHKIVDG